MVLLGISKQLLVGNPSATTLAMAALVARAAVAVAVAVVRVAVAVLS